MRHIFLHFWVKYLYAKEERRIHKAWGHNADFVSADRLLKKRYRSSNPYRVCREFFQTQGVDDPHVYGDTPMTTLYRLAALSGLNAKDCVVDLGCGTGRSVFFLQALFNCRAIGIDLVPAFIERASAIAREVSNDHVTFLNGDIAHFSFKMASWVYLDATISNDSFLKSVVNNLRECLPGTKILSVNADLRQYGDFYLVDIFQARYFWGEADVYYLRK